MTVPGVEIKGPLGHRFDEILTDPALAFLAGLHRAFDARRLALLAARAERQTALDAGALPDFLTETKSIRDGDWRVAPIPADLLDRRVEITGPVDRKMIVNALNSGAKVFMADFEDANAPTWANNLDGQINLKDRWHGSLDFTDATNGKHYALGPKPAVLLVRPRGWHLPERHLTIDGAAISGALFDFGLYFFHNARAQIAKGSGAVFLPAQAREPSGGAAVERRLRAGAEEPRRAARHDQGHGADRDAAGGVRDGRDPLRAARPHGGTELRPLGLHVLLHQEAARQSGLHPARPRQVVMGKAFLRAYSLLLIKTCHRRGAFAMGGMAAQIPNRKDKAANDAAFAKVKADKEREAGDGHDGTWVAHPDLVPVAQEVFDRLMPGPNQLARQRQDVAVGQGELLEVHDGTKSETGMRENIRVGVQYIEAWLRGRGAVPLYNLMEDAATAEISRAQVWQWVRYGVTLEGGGTATPALFERLLDEEMARIREEVGAEAFATGRFAGARALFHDLSLAPAFEEFLTLPAYELLEKV